MRTGSLTWAHFITHSLRLTHSRPFWYFETPSRILSVHHAQAVCDIGAFFFLSFLLPNPIYHPALTSVSLAPVLQPISLHNLGFLQQIPSVLPTPCSSSCLPPLLQLPALPGVACSRQSFLQCTSSVPLVYLNSTPPARGFLLGQTFL